MNVNDVFAIAYYVSALIVSTGVFVHFYKKLHNETEFYRLTLQEVILGMLVSLLPIVNMIAALVMLVSGVCKLFGECDKIVLATNADRVLGRANGTNKS